MIVKLAKVFVVAGMLAAAGCADDPSTGGDTQDLNAADYRCITQKDDGSCFSLPADCPVFFTRGNGEPHCSGDARLVLAKDDTCAEKFICTD